MTTYFSTFPVGFEPVVKSLLTATLPKLTIHNLHDGLIIYQTSAFPSTIAKLKFVSNSFILLSQVKLKSSSLNTKHYLALLDQAKFFPALSLARLPYIRSFRVIASLKNQTIPLDTHLHEQAEKRIAARLHLRVSRDRPDIEVWFMIREEDLGLLGVRITDIGRQKVKSYPPGELRQEIAHLLILLSAPTAEDVILDPFAGSGAIALERINSSPFKYLYASDLDESKIEELKRKTKWAYQKIQVTKADALKLTYLDDSSIDKIITDPPWGQFEEISNQQEFYHQMLTQFHRLLKPSGLLVLLLSRDIDLVSHLSSFPTLILKQKLDVLVSGKKSSVYLIQAQP